MFEFTINLGFFFGPKIHFVEIYTEDVLLYFTVSAKFFMVTFVWYRDAIITSLYVKDFDSNRCIHTKACI